MKAPPFDHASNERNDAASVPPEVASAPPSSWAMRLRRHLTIAFIVKLALLALLYFLFFSPSQRPHVDTQRAADHLLTPG